MAYISKYLLVITEKRAQAQNDILFKNIPPIWLYLPNYIILHSPSDPKNLTVYLICLTATAWTIYLINFNLIKPSLWHINTDETAT